jgi:hypothetical protein
MLQEQQQTLLPVKTAAKTGFGFDFRKRKRGILSPAKRGMTLMGLMLFWVLLSFAFYGEDKSERAFSTRIGKTRRVTTFYVMHVNDIRI